MDNFAISSFPTVKCPECPTNVRRFKNISDEANHLEILKIVEYPFSEFISNNLVGALSGIGSVQHPDSFRNIHLPYFWCNYCDFKTFQKIDMLEHMQTHRFGCKFCDFEVFSRGEVVKHTIKCHEEKIDKTFLWFCVLKSDTNILQQNAINRGAKRTNCNSDTHTTELINPKKIKKEALYSDSTIVQSEEDIIAPEQIPDSSLLARFKTTLDRISNEMNTSPPNSVKNSQNTVEVNTKNATTKDPVYIPDNATPKQQQPSSQSYLRSILTTDNNLLTNRLSCSRPQSLNLVKPPILAQTPKVTNFPGTLCSSSDNLRKTKIKVETGDDFYTQTRVSTHTSDTKSTKTVEDTSKTGTKPNAFDTEVTADHQTPSKIKIEIDDDSYSNQIDYIPKTLNYNSVHHGPVPHQNADTIVTPASHSIMGDVQLLNESYKVNTVNNMTNENIIVLNSPLPVSESVRLPILRTMLTMEDMSSSSVQDTGTVDEMSSDNFSTEDNDDADYCPNSSEDEDYTGTQKRVSKKKINKPAGGFACSNCDYTRYHYSVVKNHLLNNHKQTNLVLKDTNRNMFVYICPSNDCSFRDTEFTAFIHHLEQCGIFKYKTLCGSFGKTVQTTVLMTLKSILERSMTGWSYACCFCAATFHSLAEAQDHKVEKHSKCSDYNSLFKLCETTRKLIIVCTLCLSEIDVVDWAEMSFQTCKEHMKPGSAVNNKVNITPVLNQSKTTISKPDATPQLRAMLQQTPLCSANQGSPESEQLPASRMLQWLISEGSRMMHMLK